MKSIAIGLALTTLMLLANCSSERSTGPLPDNSPSHSLPDIKGTWQGMLTFTAYFDSDSLDFEFVRTRITFGDSSWQYYHMLPNGDVLAPWYSCNSSLSRYSVTDTSLHLRDACIYQAIYDGRIMFLTDYSLALDDERMVLRYSRYNPLMEAEVQQVVDLRRISD